MFSASVSSSQVGPEKAIFTESSLKAIFTKVGVEKEEKIYRDQKSPPLSKKNCQRRLGGAPLCPSPDRLGPAARLRGAVGGPQKSRSRAWTRAVRSCFRVRVPAKCAITLAKGDSPGSPVAAFSPSTLPTVADQWLNKATTWAI